MVAVAPMLTEPGVLGEREQRVVFHGVTWREYLRTRAALDHHRGIRMAYLEGALEIMRPSQIHETTKKLLARLVEIYALERGIELVGFGSTTYRKRAKERGIEPDECYCIGTGRGKRGARVPRSAPA
jgi:Uma2 family endonuclease